MARHQPYRIVSIENPAEVHVRDGQLVVIQDKGTASVPVRDIMVLEVCGPNIRMSTMAQTMLAEGKVTMLYLGRNHHPSAMTLPMVGNVRQARVAQMQAAMPAELRARHPMRTTGKGMRPSSTSSICSQVSTVARRIRSTAR